MASTGELPYEKQLSTASCGAASLCMVYRSFGIGCDQNQIWQAVASTSARGRLCARAQALAVDALRRGLHALVIQVRDPWVVLDSCLKHSVRAIVNHVPKPTSGRGHYSVLTALGDDQVILHDPNWGPGRTVTRAEFLQLWNPRSPVTEIVAQVLIGIAANRSQLLPCPLCHGIAGDEVACKSCRRSVVLQPLAILGCLTDWCPMRAWEQVFCPWCDHFWTKDLSSAKPRATPGVK